MNKPFDLKAFKRGEPAITRDGVEAKFIAYVPEAESHHKIIFIINKYIYTCQDDGRQFKKADSGNDLFMKPKKKTVWINLYSSSGDSRGFGNFYVSKEKADECSSPGRVGNCAWPLEIEE